MRIKPWLMACCLMACCLMAASGSTGFSQSQSEMKLFETLTKGPGKEEVLDTVLEAPETYSGIVLYVSAGVAFEEERLEDSAFLFYAGQLRSRFDQKCFPPKGTGANNPFLANGALSHQLGTAINTAVMAEPKTFAKVIKRLKKWNPTAPDKYKPGYEFKERLSEKDARAAAESNRTEFLSRMENIATLLGDDEYFAAFRVVQNFDLETGDKQPTKEERDEATETMKRIEKEKNLPGLFGATKSK